MTDPPIPPTRFSVIPFEFARAGSDILRRLVAKFIQLTDSSREFLSLSISFAEAVGLFADRVWSDQIVGTHQLELMLPAKKASLLLANPAGCFADLRKVLGEAQVPGGDGGRVMARQSSHDLFGDADWLTCRCLELAGLLVLTKDRRN